MHTVCWKTMCRQGGQHLAQIINSFGCHPVSVSMSQRFIILPLISRVSRL